MSQLIDLPDYLSENFVNRKDEYGLIIGHIDDLLTGPRERGPRQTRTFIIQGEHGMGKSWLLAHLGHTFAQDDRVSHFMLNLDDYWNDESPEESVKAIWYQIYQHFFNQTLEQSTSLEQLSHHLIKELREKILKDRPLILLIDSVYEADRNLLQVLEEYFLAPLIVEANIILVMAGRGKPYTWVSPELRIRARFIDLKPFTVPDTERQLILQLPTVQNRAAHIYDIGQGNPKTTYLIGTAGSDLDAVSQVITDMLAYLTTETRDAVRQSAEALCLPNRFDLKLATALLDEYISTDRPRQRRRVLAEIDDLVSAGLVLWSTEKRAYTFYDSTHHLLRQYMHYSQPDRSLRLHQIALDFYQAWVDSQPRNWERWQKEVDHHIKSMAELRRSL